MIEAQQKLRVDVTGDARSMKVGVAGLGFGATEFIPTLERLPQIDIVAGADLRKHALTEFARRYGARTYGSVEELCKDPGVEAVWIATPNQHHAEHAIIAAEHGKHVLLRKPMGVSVEECIRVQEAVDRAGVKLLAGGQTLGTSPVVRAARRIIASGELGPLRAINVWAYTGWMLRPREAHEVDDDQGGGVVWRQAPHQIETIRYLGGGRVRSVRAMTGRWRPERPNGTGYYAAYLEFEEGVPVTAVYNAYGYFDTVDLVCWAEDRGRDSRARMRKALLNNELDEAAGKEATRFAGAKENAVVGSAEGGPWLPSNLGVFIVSCQEGDLRMSPKGLYIYDADGLREVPVPHSTGPGMSLETEVMEFYNAVKTGAPLFHDGHWGLATVEVQSALLKSAARREEIILQHQVPVPPGE